MIPDPENGETSSKSSPARRLLSPFTEDRIRSGQVWLDAYLSLSLQKIGYASENCEQAPIFFSAFTIFAEDRRLFRNLGE